MDKQVEAVIELEGNELRPFSSIRISQQIHRHLVFQIGLSTEVVESPDDPFTKKSQQLLGKAVKIVFRYPKDKAKSSAFHGLITEIGSAKNSVYSNEIYLHGMSCSILLEGAENCRSFSDKSMQQIVDAVLQPYPKNLLKTKVSPKSREPLSYVVQYRESDFNFISRLADRFGEWVLFDGEYLHVGEIAAAAPVDLFLGKDLLRFELVQRVEHTKFKLKSYDYLKNEVYSSASADAAAGALSPPGDFALQKSESVMNYAPLATAAPPINTVNALKALAGALKGKRLSNLVVLNGVSENPLVKVGAKIKVAGGKGQAGNGGTESYGEFLVIKISHTIDAGGNYQNSFEALPVESKSPPNNPGLISPVGEMQTAVVKENNDPEKLGRVRVNFVWQEASDLSPWLRVATPHAGKDKGIYFTPEIGEEVLVGFEHNNPDKPFVLGSAFHGKIKPEPWHHPENNVKAIMTKSGNIVYFNDEAGNEEILVANKDKSNQISLSLKGDGKIIIKSKGALELSGKSIKLQTQELTMESTNTTMKASGKCAIDGGGLAEIKAQLIKLN